jgi:hypothetical protein
VIHTDQGSDWGAWLLWAGMWGVQLGQNCILWYQRTVTRRHTRSFRYLHPIIPLLRC